MPLLQEELSVFYDDLANLTELMPAKTPHVRQRHGLQPILRVASGLCDMDVWCSRPSMLKKKNRYPRTLSSAVTLADYPSDRRRERKPMSA